MFHHFTANTFLKRSIKIIGEFSTKRRERGERGQNQLIFTNKHSPIVNINFKGLFRGDLATVQGLISFRISFIVKCIINSILTLFNRNAR